MPVTPTGRVKGYILTRQSGMSAPSEAIHATARRLGKSMTAALWEKALEGAIVEAFEAVTVSDAQGWFTHAGCGSVV
jgi:hypothetical protein